MQITIKLFASYRIGRFKEAEREYPPGASVGNVLQSLNINGFRGAVLVNGTAVAESRLLSDGDTVTLFPLVSGG